MNPCFFAASIIGDCEECGMPSTGSFEQVDSSEQQFFELKCVGCGHSQRFELICQEIDCMEIEE